MDVSQATGGHSPIVGPKAVAPGWRPSSVCLGLTYDLNAVAAVVLESSGTLGTDGARVHTYTTRLVAGWRRIMENAQR